MSDRLRYHLGPEVIASFLDRTLSSRQMAELQAHLAECTACRREVVEAGRIISSGPPRIMRRSPRWAFAAAIVLAAVGGPLLWQQLSSVAQDDNSLERGAASTARLELHLPASDATLQSGESIRFVWSAVGEGTTFRITLLDDVGGRVWATEVGDTTVLMPRAVSLPGPGVYFWYVDALGPDGRSQSNGPNRFVIR